MDAGTLKSISQGILIAGVIFSAIGTAGSLYYGKNAEKIAPYKQPIRTAIASIEIIIQSSEDLNSRFMQQGAELIFGKRNHPLLSLSSTQSTGIQLGEHEVRYSAEIKLAADHPAMGKPINFLTESEYIQIYFVKVPKECNVLSGKIICTFNSMIRMQSEIPSQQIQNGKIFVRDLMEIFTGFPRK